MNGKMNVSSQGTSSSINISPEATGGASYGYSIGFSLAVLLLLVIISYVSYKCNKSSAVTNLNFSAEGSSLYTNTAIDHNSVTAPNGLDEATFVNYPKFIYSDAKPHKDDPIDSSCSICLADYKCHHMLRLLPDCGHLFHLKCIDPWLKLHPSCPICRRKPLTTTAEVDPLAMQQID